MLFQQPQMSRSVTPNFCPALPLQGLLYLSTTIVARLYCTLFPGHRDLDSATVHTLACVCNLTCIDLYIDSLTLPPWPADYTPSPSTATSWTNTTHGSSIATAYSGRARGSSPASWTCCSISANTVSKHQASISLLRSLSTVIAQTSPYYS